MIKRWRGRKNLDKKNEDQAWKSVTFKWLSFADFLLDLEISKNCNDQSQFLEMETGASFFKRYPVSSETF